MRLSMMAVIEQPAHYGNDTAPYDNSLLNDTRCPLVLSVCSIFYGLVILVFLLRMYTQVYIAKQVALHDYFMLLSWVCMSFLLQAANIH